MTRPRQVELFQKGSSTSTSMIVLAILAGIAGVIWFLTQEPPPPPPAQPIVVDEPTPDPQPVLPPQVEAAPDIPVSMPVPEAQEPEEPVAPELTLPLLEESDEFFREQLLPLSTDSEYALWLQTDNLIQKSAAIIDGLSNGNLLRKIIPIQPPAGKFLVIREDNRIWLDEQSFQRHDPLIDLLTSLPPQALAAAFNTLRPLFEEAYTMLGLPAEKVDNSLIAAIDTALATPVINNPIALKQESVLFQFADPELEALPDIQKQVIRFGPDNREKLFTYLQELRSTLLAGES